MFNFLPVALFHFILPIQSLLTQSCENISCWPHILYTCYCRWRWQTHGYSWGQSINYTEQFPKMNSTTACESQTTSIEAELWSWTWENFNRNVYRNYKYKMWYHETSATYIGLWIMSNRVIFLPRQRGRLCKWLTGSTKALVIDGSFTTVTVQFVSRSCGISLLLLSSWLATWTTRLYAGWAGGRKWSLCNSHCCNKTNPNVEHTKSRLHGQMQKILQDQDCDKVKNSAEYSLDNLNIVSTAWVSVWKEIGRKLITSFHYLWFI
jgi:hypothetical protein